MTVDYHKLNQAAILITVAILGLGSLLDQIKKASVCIVSATGLADALLSPIITRKEDQKLFLFTWIE